MPKESKETYQRILQAAKQEFLAKGFQGTAMRDIAHKVGMSAAGIYRHFEGKEDLFTALVEPGLQACEVWYLNHRERDYQLLEQSRLEDMWEIGADVNMILDVVYPHFDSFKLLLCCAEGTRHANFLHDFVMLEQKETMDFLQAAAQRGIAVQQIRPNELHLLLSAYVTALFEVVLHDFPKEEAAHYLKTLQTFFYPGWRAVLGL